MLRYKNLICVLSLCILTMAHSKVTIGLDRFFSEGFVKKLEGKNIGIITNHTGINCEYHTTVELFKQHAGRYHIKALFSPEHGIAGDHKAAEKVQDSYDQDGIPIYSLHGKTKRPTKKMLQGLDTLIFDIQDIGVRSYTYISTLFYVMEEAASENIEVIVLDRPNPLGGNLVDGLLLEEQWRSFLGYVNVPYCHGMTVGELALLFNDMYHIKCKLLVIPMNGWKRSMNYQQTGLPWIPTSPHIPEWNTPYYIAATGILGALNFVNVGVGYTTPFKVVGAPWIDATLLAKHLNAQKIQGVYFHPFHYRPFYGSYKGKHCHGVLIQITDYEAFQPLTVQYLLIGIFKTLYPKKMEQALARMQKGKQDLFCHVNGTGSVLSLLKKQGYFFWPLMKEKQTAVQSFQKTRQKYLLKQYD